MAATLYFKLSKTENPAGGQPIPPILFMENTTTKTENATTEPAHPSPLAYVQKGLTKREWFAGMALSGMDINIFREPEMCVDKAIQYADLMISKLNNDANSNK